MDRRRARRLLVTAFVLSLLIHVLIASGLRWPFELNQSQTPEVIRVQHLRLARIVSPPPHTPAPTPPPATPAPIRTSAPVRTRVPHSVGVPGAGAAGSATPQPKPIATAAPAAVPSAAPCAHNDLPAAIAQSPPPADISPAARADGASGTARIHVTLDADGSVQNAVVAATSGSNSLDLVAMTMARAARYTPARHDCKAVASDYTYSVKFVSW